MKIKPVGNRVILKPIEKSQTSDGIFIPDSIKDKPMYFVVQDIGQGFMNNEGKITPIQKNGIINVHGRENKNKTKLKNTTLRLISIVTKKQKNTNLNKLVFSSESTSINSLKDVPFNGK